jgi:hypothetical protein
VKAGAWLPTGEPPTEASPEGAMMSPILSWRRVVSVFVLLLAVAGLVAARSLPGADAQEPGGSTFVFSNIVVTASNGNVVLADLGQIDGVLGIACTGASPRSGNLIPGQVVTELTVNDTRLRVIRNDGAAITGTVRINCVIEFGSFAEGEAAADRLGVARNAG